jgi:hypothetical protein
MKGDVRTAKAGRPAAVFQVLRRVLASWHSLTVTRNTVIQYSRRSILYEWQPQHSAVFGVDGFPALTDNSVGIQDAVLDIEGAEVAASAG